MITFSNIIVREKNTDIWNPVSIAVKDSRYVPLKYDISLEMLVILAPFLNKV